METNNYKHYLAPEFEVITIDVEQGFALSNLENPVEKPEMNWQGIIQTDMKRLLTLLVLVLCSCTETFVGKEIARPNNEILPDLTAAFADEEATRTYVENGKYLRWHEDDRITAFYGNTLNRQYKFNGSTGDNSGTFSLVPSGELGTGNALNHIYALYPYSANATISDEGVISLTLSDTQTYAENSFGIGANTMVAVTENLEDTFLAFKNACGYLKLKLYNAEGATIKSIEVKGNNGEKLAGEATLTINFGGAPILTMADTATDTITLNCGDGVTLGTTAEEATELWVVVPATTFTEGLTITATDMDGKVFEKTTTNEVVVERNAIQPMATLEHNAEYPLTLRQIHYHSSYGKYGKIESENWTFGTFGANIISNEFDEATNLWTITFDDAVTRIGSYAFSECSGLTSVTIPDSVTTIGSYAFENCSGLTSVYITDLSAWCKIDFGDYDANPLYYAENLYLNNELVTNLVIPNEITKIKPSVFYGYRSLTSVTIPDSVTEIGSSAFDGCSSLTSVTIPDSVTKIGSATFAECRNLTSVTIPDSVVTIGSFAFIRCYCLTSVTIPDSVTTIGNSAFYQCSSLTSVTIPDSVTTIGETTFYKCSRLTSVTIGCGVTKIERSAFYDCISLINVYCKAITPPIAVADYFGDWGAFDGNASGRKIYVPRQSIEAYKSASYWKNYADAIVGYNVEIGEVEKYCTINLNNAWRQSTSVSNPDSSLYDGVYESYSNYNKDNGAAMMYIDIEGYNEFCFYIRSDAESTYDYVTVSELDSTSQKVSTSGKQNSGTALSNYTKVTYTGIDGGSHRIIVTYRKDGSVNQGSDRGYVLIPKNQ